MTDLTDLVTHFGSISRFINFLPSIVTPHAVLYGHMPDRLQR
jgi:hypothetical protein